MKNANQNPNDHFKNQDEPLDTQVVNQSPQSTWFGSFHILKSPLFVVVTIFIIAITLLVFHRTQDLQISILFGVVMLLLFSVIIWQYLLVSRRLEDLSHQSSGLHQLIESVQNSVLDKIVQESSSSKAAHGHTHRMIVEMSSDQSNILQSTTELKKALKLICDHIEITYAHFEQWQVENVETLGEITKSLSALKSETIKDLQNQSQERFGEISQSLSALKSETIKDLQNQNQERFGEISQSLSALKNETIKDLQNQSQERFGEISQSLSALKSETIKDLKNQNQKRFGEISQSLSALKSETMDEFKHTYKTVHDSNQSTSSEIQGKLADLVRESDQSQQKALEELVNEQIEGLLNGIIATNTTLKTSLVEKVHESLKTLKGNLTTELPEKTALVFDDRLLALSQKIELIFTKQNEQLENLSGHISAIEGEVTSFTDQESGISNALEVSTAIDRLNLEVRRQLAELRLKLNQ